MRTENFEESIWAYLWYFIPGIIFLIPLVINFPKSLDIPALAQGAIIFTVGYVIHAFVRLITFQHYFGTKNYSNDAKYSFDYLRKVMNVKWNDDFVNCVYNYYFYSNKDEKYASLIKDIKRKSFYNIANGVMAWSFLFGAIIASLLITRGPINLYILFAYLMATIMVVILEQKLHNHIELQEAFLIGYHRKDMQKNKGKIEKIYKELKDYGMLK
ncbi:MAG: hypothetical protein KAT83_02950 [Candidatus Aenigmarchaeota archaeon]|nr:hypothetical protein [Candidatus Aenigmarchaeota archaeon]